MAGAAPQGLADRIRKLRIERGWSARELAEECARLGTTTLTRGTIAKIESGVRKSVTASEIDILGRALEVELNTLVRGADVDSLMTELYRSEAAARTVLIGIGFPPHLIPSWTQPGEFWSAVVFQLDRGFGVTAGVAALVQEAAREYPGNARVQALNADLSGADQAEARGTDPAALMAELYFSESAARSVLAHIGFPPKLMPVFSQPQEFWVGIIHQLSLGLGVDEGITKLIEVTATLYPGNKAAQALAAKLTNQRATTVTTPSRTLASEGPTPTLMLIGADLPIEFLEVVREQLGSDAAELLYVSKQQCAVAIPDPGDRAAQLQQQIQELMQTYAPDARVQVVYERFQFRPYLYSDLTVLGPDRTPYLLQSVPATLTPHDIAAAIVAETRAMNDRPDAELSAVIDAETEDGRERLDPDKTLHENKVKDKGRLRVGTKAIGSGRIRVGTNAIAGGEGNEYPHDFAARTEAQRRMVEQLRQYSEANPDFAVTYLDDEELPSRIVAEVTANGFAPPEDLDYFLVGAGRLSPAEYNALPLDQLKPLSIRHHRLTIELPPLFPNTPPFIVWNTPVFHPNIWPDKLPGYRPGTVFLRQLAQEYMPQFNFNDLCQALVDLVEYRLYDPYAFPELPAARWALSKSGQATIALNARKHAAHLTPTSLATDVGSGTKSLAWTTDGIQQPPSPPEALHRQDHPLCETGTQQTPEKAQGTGGPV